MRSHLLAIIMCSGIGLVSACNVPIERFEHPDAATDAAGDDANRPPPFVPLHLPAETMISGAPDLLLSANPTSIDTTALTIGGLTSPYFVQRGDYAVLFVNALSVENPVTITGASPLIVAASGQVTIFSHIELSAVGRTPGPGAAVDNPGGGGAGQSAVLAEPVASGGGGAGYGTPGAPGGASSMCAAGTGGMIYGMQSADPLLGGSSGGDGGRSVQGGEGGGALQISSAISISISSTGQIKSGGGGGDGGGGGVGGGGGGGSGGEILLEAPSIAIAGRLVANGGGGGGGGANGLARLGADGQDGTDNTTPASGGVGGIPQGSDGGAGAAGAAGMFADATRGGQYNSKAGGGGGGAGRIWLRHRAATPPILTGAVISPPAGLDPTLP